jgi:acyl carrier protein
MAVDHRRRSIAGVESGAVTFETVRKLIAQTCEIDPEVVKPEARLSGYGIDSVRGLELVVALEEALQLQIPEEALLEIKTVKDLVTFVDKLRAAR